MGTLCLAHGIIWTDRMVLGAIPQKNNNTHVGLMSALATQAGRGSLRLWSSTREPFKLEMQGNEPI